MSRLTVDVERLKAFEEGLDVRFPERSAIPARVLGYGEISTVLEIGAGGQASFACKRLPKFATLAEAEAYEALHGLYVNVLRDQVGIRVVPSQTVCLEGPRGITVYIVQEKLQRGTIGHQAIHVLETDDVIHLVLAVLRETKKVFDFNSEALALGFDAQISNWAIVGFDPQVGRLLEQPELVYFDTSSPLLQDKGEEKLNPDLFLRSAPSFMVWLIRLLFLEDVMTRYYDPHHVVVDLMANFYKEQRPELIPALVDVANHFFRSEIDSGTVKPFTVKEVRSYYREDAWIWRTYLAARKIDRWLHRLARREYAYILPEKVRR